LAVAAVAASILLSKARHAPEVPETEEQNVYEHDTSLQALRAAGF